MKADRRLIGSSNGVREKSGRQHAIGGFTTHVYVVVFAERRLLGSPKSRQ